MLKRFLGKFRKKKEPLKEGEKKVLAPSVEEAPKELKVSRRWTPDEDEKLLLWKKEGKSEDEIGRLLGRHKGTVRLRYGQLVRKMEAQEGSKKEVRMDGEMGDLKGVLKGLGLGDDVVKMGLAFLDQRIDERVKEAFERERPKIIEGVKDALMEIAKKYLPNLEGSPSESLQGSPSTNPQGDFLLRLLSSYLSSPKESVEEMVRKEASRQVDMMYKGMRLAVDMMKGRTVRKKDLVGD